ncbi:ras-like GTP-binding protein [Usnea florida]
MPSSLEAKICVLGAQGVGKTSLLHRYVKGTFNPPSVASTIGASFLTKRVIDVDSGITVRLQLWDTAGQERFRSITKLYYRGASAILLVYSIIEESSFEEMGRWLTEMRESLGNDIIIHVVGTKSDMVAQDPSLRKIPFEKCIAYVAENLFSQNISTPILKSDGSARSSGFWGQEIGWDCCHEISASNGEGIEEVFRVITRKLVEQRNKKEHEQLQDCNSTKGHARGQGGYFDGSSEIHGSFRLSNKRQSWLGIASTPGIVTGEEMENRDPSLSRNRTGKCC